MTNPLVVGENIPSVNGRRDIAEDTKHSLDNCLPNTLHEKIPEGRYPHAKIIEIDVFGLIPQRDRCILVT